MPFSNPNATVMLQAIPELGIASLGVGLLMIAGEFDLSIGANYTFSAVVMASLFGEACPFGWPPSWPSRSASHLVSSTPA